MRDTTIILSNVPLCLIKRDPDRDGMLKRLITVFFLLEICTMVIVAGWYLLWFIPLCTALHVKKKREREGAKASRGWWSFVATIYMRSFFFNIFRIAGLISRKETLSIRLCRSFANLCSWEHSVGWLFFFFLFLFHSFPVLDSWFVFFSFYLLRSKEEFASDSTYAEKLTKVPTYCASSGSRV